ncbi:integral membrane protein [Colletotrichum cuscutae]|uniref:Integral membrane protein n=1 Tax=Colletotrichum cuscutae TaxID=1209917 RepID=A0AAI9YDS5_9PEZI|nr:integral membrane protein [Colletotrichum cuscutae]
MSSDTMSARDAENKGPTALAIVVCVSVLSTVFTAARLFTRGKVLGKISLDDYFIVASVVCGWMNVATAAVAVSYGYGRHADTLSVDEKSGAMLWSIAGYPPGLLSFGIPKLAVVALLTRILNPSRWHKRFLWALSIICVVNLIGFITIIFAQCSPARSQWDSSVSGKCWSKWILVSFATYSGAFCAFADVYLSVYPAVVLSKLQMNRRKKIALSVALGFGSLSGIVVIYKCIKLPSLTSSDYTYDTVELVIWTVVEGSIIIIAACIPVLQPLGELLFGKRIFSSGNGKYLSGNSKSRLSGRLGTNKGLFRTPVKKASQEEFDADSFNRVGKTTVVGRGSQESILEQHNSDGKIVRTDAFTVTIEMSKTDRH